MRKPIWARGVGLACALVLAGCGSDDKSGKKPGAGSGESARAVLEEGWCDRAGLTPALRQTVVIIDERVIVPGLGADFRTSNSALFEAVSDLGLAGSQSPGVMSPRERLSLYLAPSDGGSPRLIYSGCAPGLSTEEAASIRSGRSGFGDFVGGDLAHELEEANEAHKRSFIIAFTRLGDRPAPPPARRGGFAESSLLSALKSTRQLAHDGAAAPRYVIFTDLAIFPAQSDVVAGRKAGFAAARQAQIALGGAEVVLMGPGGAEAARLYARAFFLGSQGNLLGWGSGALGNLPEAPVSLAAYAGELRYPTDRFPARMIVGRDRANRLVNSWLIVNSDSEWATPIGGSLSCASDVCSLIQDRSGLGQQWNPQTNGPAQFDAALPLSGMRGLRAVITPETAKGEVFDPEVGSFEGAPGVSTLPFELNILASGN